MLEHDEGLPRRQHAGVVQSRDVRMTERRQRVALARESLHVPALQHEHGHLERDRALHHAVGTFRQPHHRHAAAAQLADQPISGEHSPGCSVRVASTFKPRHAVDHGRARARGIAPETTRRQQALEARVQCRIACAASSLSEARALGSSAASSRSSQSSASHHSRRTPSASCR